jgi:pantoate--beta-alanine ligase
MRISDRIDEVRAILRRARNKGSTVGLVPTMGALHEGHVSLIRKARYNDDFVVVSVFVNPTQFAPGEDLDRYPRQLHEDAALVEQLGGDLVFAPTVEEMYPADFCTYVEVEALTEQLCGAFRPGHFRGVTTVVAKLLSIIAPDRAYFGEKDYQQLLVIERMTRDLNIPVEIVSCPTVREPDGLAMSSRNKHLTAEQRQSAPAIYRALQKAAGVVRSGATGAEAEQVLAMQLQGRPLLRVQYARALDPDTLQEPTHSGPPMLLAVAAFAGDTRLIDNMIVRE